MKHLLLVCLIGQLCKLDYDVLFYNCIKTIARSLCKNSIWDSNRWWIFINFAKCQSYNDTNRVLMKQTWWVFLVFTSIFLPLISPRNPQSFQSHKIGKSLYDYLMRMLKKTNICILYFQHLPDYRNLVYQKHGK